MNNSRERWTEKEDEILRKYYSSEGEEVGRRLPDRSYCAIKDRVTELGLKRDGYWWTKEEDNILKKYYPKEGGKAFERVNTHSISSCKTRVKKLNLKRYTKSDWTKKEDEVLEKYYPSEMENVCVRLPNRSKKEIKQRAAFKGIKASYYWTDEEDNIIRKYYPSEGIKVKRRLSRDKSTHSITQRAHRLGVITKAREGRKDFTPDEDMIIKEYFPSEGIKIANRLNDRAVSSIYNRARILNVKNADPLLKWSKKEENILKKYYPFMGSKVTSMLPNRSNASIRSHAMALGIKYIASGKRAINE